MSKRRPPLPSPGRDPSAGPLRPADAVARPSGDLGLHERAEQFRLIVESAVDYAIVAMDLDRIVTAWNEGAMRLLGFSADDIIGRTADVFFTEEDRRHGDPEREASLALAQGRAANERWHLRKDGSRFWGSGLMAPLRDPTGAVRGLVKIFRDMTAAKAAAEEREQLLAAAEEAREEAERANRAKDEFLALLSHELRSPINAMLNWVRILQSSGPRDPALVTRAATTLERNIRLQAQIISDLLDVSRIVSGKLELEHERLELNALLAGCVESLRPTAEAKQVALALRLPNAELELLGDAARLQQVFSNLIGNALKFTPAGGRVDISAQRRERSAVVVVEDNGEGIAGEFLPKLFDRFSQGDSSATRRHGGLGLGLSIVKSVVVQHGGEVTAASPGVGLGAQFTVVLPLAEASLRAAGVAAAAQESGLLSANLEVLVVEDDDDTRQAVEWTLRQRGAQVRAVPTVEEALAAYGARRPDAIVSDIGMPGQDGYSLIREVRRREAGAARPVIAIAITGLAARQDRQAAISAGFDDHLVKPLEPSDLVQRLQELLRARA